MSNTISYTTTDGQVHTMELMGQGSATLANAEDIAKDEHGFTNPNLHRRIDNQEHRSYVVGVYGIHSYRTTKINVHDEDSTTSEIP